jgi:hypothetical protein
MPHKPSFYLQGSSARTFQTCIELRSCPNLHLPDFPLDSTSHSFCQETNSPGDLLRRADLPATATSQHANLPHKMFKMIPNIYVASLIVSLAGFVRSYSLRYWFTEVIAVRLRCRCDWPHHRDASILLYRPSSSRYGRRDGEPESSFCSTRTAADATLAESSQLVVMQDLSPNSMR